MQKNVVVVGAGMGGLVAACLLGRAGCRVQLLEAAPQVGGKAYAATVAGRSLDMGPSVLTLRSVFDGVFAACGERLEDHLTLALLPQLARHAWADGVLGAPARLADGRVQTLDLFADAQRSQDAIGAVFGAAAAREYAAFVAYSAKLYAAAADTFIFGAKPTLLEAARSFGTRVLTAAWEMDARRTMAAALQKAFPKTVALQQLFGRYATYCGASPYLAPATLNLVAHVERLGVYRVEGGISAVAAALGELAGRQGVTIRCNAPVAELVRSGRQVTGVRLLDGELVEAGAVVFAGDLRAFAANAPWQTPEAAAAAQLPLAEGLSADVTGIVGRADNAAGFAPTMHNVVFTGSAQDEFTDLFVAKTRPRRPTVYVCAPDRADGTDSVGAEERFFCLRNAPPTRLAGPAEEQRTCNDSLLSQLRQGGLHLQPAHPQVTAGAPDFARRFPGSDGALYGQPPHTWRSFFTRPGSATRSPNTFCAGGGVHPGPGVPMAALSGQRAAEALLAACPSLVRSDLVATRGGTWTPKATTAPTSSPPSSL